MKNPTIKIISILALGVCLALTLNLLAQDAPQPDPAPAAKQWQHLALAHEADKEWNAKELAQQINQLGREGWEMVSVLNFNKDGTTDNTIYYFKKPL